MALKKAAAKPSKKAAKKKDIPHIPIEEIAILRKGGGVPEAKTPRKKK